MSEGREARVKRLHMRSIRRGIKEMDLILTAFAQTHLAGLSDDALETYDALLSENDHDLYGWVTGQFETPARYTHLMPLIAKGAHGLTRPG